MTDIHAPQPGEFLLYDSEDGRACVHATCRFVGDMLGLAPALMAELSQPSPQNVPLHLKARHAEGETIHERMGRRQ